MELYERIKELAANKKISIRQLEEALKFGNGTINRWRSNTPGVDKIQKVADYFGVSVDYLLGRGEAHSPESEQLSAQEKKLLMRFRRGSKNLSEDEKVIYERQAMNLFDYINKTMHDLDEKNKPK